MHYIKCIDTPIENGITLSLYQYPKIDEENDKISNIPYASPLGSLTYDMLHA